MADLNSATSWFESDAANTAAPPNGWPAGMFPNQVEPTAQAMMGALKRWWNRSNAVYTSSGAAGHYVVTPSNASFPTAYVAGERFCWKTDKASAGGDDLNWNGLGAKPLYKVASGTFVALGVNDIPAGQVVEAFYDATLNGGIGGFQIRSGLGFDTGTRAIFVQASAPTGWIQVTGLSDKVLRITDAGGGTTGGSWTISGASVAGHALSLGEMPGHDHGLGNGNSFPVWAGAFTTAPGGSTYVGSQLAVMTAQGGNAAHNHGWSNDGTWRPAYADAIVASKT